MYELLLIIYFQMSGDHFLQQISSTFVNYPFPLGFCFLSTRKLILLVMLEFNVHFSALRQS